MPLTPTPDEIAERDRVLSAVEEAVLQSRTIAFSVQVMGQESAFGGQIGIYLYAFEGEEDLLHLIVTRADGGTLSPAEGLEVAKFLLPNVPPALIWLKPGETSQHFYLGHDDLFG